MGIDAEFGDVVNASTRKNIDEIAIVGAGPAGLFAAEIIASRGHRVTIYERMPSPARKFLLAGRGGLNLTHSEPLELFLERYGATAAEVRKAVEDFPPVRLMAWANGLGADLFTGSSGRVFPRAMKSSPLLRAWLRRLGDLGVTLKTRHRWTGFTADGALTFEGPGGTIVIVRPDAALLALGGATWPKLGADGSWVHVFASNHIPVTPLVPANCGVVISWSDVFRSRFEGTALKRIAITMDGITQRGEAIITRHGLEGSGVYALVPFIREAISMRGAAIISVDLKPDASIGELATRLARPRGKDTLTNFLRKTLHLDAAAIGLLRETGVPQSEEALAARIKAVPLEVQALAGIDRAISTAGGVCWHAVDRDLMLQNHPGIFVAGEMLDWEAPTGGYLLQATFATAARAANGLLAWCATRP